MEIEKKTTREQGNETRKVIFISKKLTSLQRLENNTGNHLPLPHHVWQLSGNDEVGWSCLPSQRGPSNSQWDSFYLAKHTSKQSVKG